jgi:subtilisin family serine protease
MKYFCIFFLFFIPGIVICQHNIDNESTHKYINSYNKDLEKDKLMGASVDKTYKEILKSKQTKKTVVVAIIDGGVDINHEDLKGKIWINEDEIPSNGIDDDKNGYIDDRNGWNFLGNKDGENIIYENYECTRIIKKGKLNNPCYEKSLELYNLKLEKQNFNKANLQAFIDKWIYSTSVILEHTSISIENEQDLDKIITRNELILRSMSFLKHNLSKGRTLEKAQKKMQEQSSVFKYQLNLNYNPREIIGDNPEKIDSYIYGNHNVISTTASHGTSVAGVIAANRENDMGINGIASDVKIMPLRAVPNGAERDKDVAMAIFYAVDNNADIINLSFGKYLSPQKNLVDSAIRYAEKKNVLIIHASGNEGANIDTIPSFPNDLFIDQTYAKNWIEVGATDLQLNSSVVAGFSNYGKNQVDIFAPGVNIVSLDTSNNYRISSGTSLAAPIVTGVAALMLSYYPELTAEELKSIILNESYLLTKPRKVYVPIGTDNKTKKEKFSNLSKSGRIINSYLIFQYLENHY